MLDIVLYPDPCLTRPCRQITDEELAAGKIDVGNGKMDISVLAAEMTTLMRQNKGVGLAAPQVGLNIHMFIADLPTASAAPLVFINPVLSDLSGEDEAIEGCLSLPGIGVKVKRAKRLNAKAKNQNGIEFDIEADGILAKVIQHEDDHCHGILIIQKKPPTKKVAEALDELERKYKNWEERKKRSNPPS